MSSQLQPDRPARPPDQPPTPTKLAGRTPRIGKLWAAVWGSWAEARGYQRLAYVVGARLILVGLAHAAIWAVVGGWAAGALSWRKPTAFGISFWRPHSWLRPRSPPSLLTTATHSPPRTNPMQPRHGSPRGWAAQHRPGTSES